MCERAQEGIQPGDVRASFGDEELRRRRGFADNKARRGTRLLNFFIRDGFVSITLNLDDLMRFMFKDFDTVFRTSGKTLQRERTVSHFLQSPHNFPFEGPCGPFP